ncbi:MAG: GNAT family N-acetyltransferase [Acidimicrobiales bacterium]|jgi:ribosomal protein S18 acetylase RimI-like enzyme|nr:GNAT family N-acetyltransferase [Acidimicrobiales bacterium]MDP6298863.1 GNAT family N-acetyltransferase [Acidimicrobiales bacterium]HJM28670.1 GNAT family N-acetyltransferase [Acidimicrobiales bacterium]HJM97017.1 GNAT family N-acetyltransferase [Acidimicrobiales bacterium]
MVGIRIADESTDKLVDAYKELIPQLSTSSHPPTKKDLEQIIKSDSAMILVAENNDGEIVGTMTLVLFKIPTGVRAWIEDVVVDAGSRGEGIGKKLNRKALDLAHEAGAKTVDLTSRPSRESANRLYQDLGFKKRETNVYRFSFD